MMFTPMYLMDGLLHIFIYVVITCVVIKWFSIPTYMKGGVYKKVFLILSVYSIVSYLSFFEYGIIYTEDNVTLYDIALLKIITSIVICLLAYGKIKIKKGII